MSHPCIHIEGALIPADILESIAAGEAEGQTGADFGLPKTARLTDEIAAAWADARAYWEAFQHGLARLAPHESATTVTREQLMLPLLRSLGYHHTTFQPRATVIGNSTYAISHRDGPDGSGVPIHIAGCDSNLDQRPPTGRPRLSPHGLMQEYLNRSEDLWGLVTNGYRLRVLRDSALMTRPSYIEFDLQQMLEGEHFADFGVMYRLIHRSRLPRTVEDAPQCLLEQYFQRGVEQGGRVRDRLRDGVEEALKIMGSGFLRHPNSENLRERIRRGDLTAPAYYRQLLRLVYRLLFLMVSEERNLIGPEDAHLAELYRRYYSVTRLREQAGRYFFTDERHADLWQGLRYTFRLFEDETLAGRMNMHALDGDLFGPNAIPDLDSASLYNVDFLSALRCLSLYTEDRTMRRVNYAALDVEELGSVYESLLDYHPVIEPHGAQMAFKFVAGSERKTTGSYYTPPALVQELIRSALEPIIQERLRETLTPGPSSNALGEGKSVGEGRALTAGRSANALGEGDGVREEGSTPLSQYGRGVGGEGQETDAGERVRLPHPSRELIERARELRKKGTPAETLLWELLRGRQLHGRKFRRQHPIGRFIADFFCDDARLIIELDGAVHQEPDQKARDRIRDEILRQHNLHVLRFSNDEVLHDIESVLQRISDHILTHSFEHLSANSQAAQGQVTPLAQSTGRGAGGEGSPAERALLSLKVCDPACGSGHFLLAAARRIGQELARVRSGEEHPPPEAYRRAVRDVIQHCIYGVDKNPLAVDLCKVALWLEGHNRGLPLTFLDHRIKCGDSLVGVLDLNVLVHGIPDDAYKPVSGDDKKLAADIRNRNRREREGQLGLELPAPPDTSALARLWAQLSDMPDDDVDAIRRKQAVYEQARAQGSAWWTLWTACNLWTAAFFMALTPGPSPKVLGEGSELPHSPSSGRGVRGEGPHIPTTNDVRRYLKHPRAADGQMVGLANAIAAEQSFFHWPLEFPDVFQRGGFDTIVGNPPFLGGLKISASFSDRYRKYLLTSYVPAGGMADLCAYFYRRAFDSLHLNGHFGLVATNTISQGDTRESGLAVILHQGGNITNVHRFVKWSGDANVEVNLIATRKGEWRKERWLDGQSVNFISSRLDSQPENEPKHLLQNAGRSFQGDIPRGIGFVLEPPEAFHLLQQSPHHQECLIPYVNGEDLNSRPDQSGSRWIICFHDWPLAQAERYPDLLRIVEQRVKPERELVKQAKDRDQWWLFAAYRRELRQAIAPLQRVLVRSRVSELHMLVFVRKGYIYSEQTVVFAFDDDYHFALLQSSLHEAWVRKNASTMRTDIRYTPTDCFETFAFPQSPLGEVVEWAARVGAEYHEHRRQTMLARNLGLTKTYNLFHRPDVYDEDIQKLRDLHAEMDRAILACYGWQDLDLAHGFHENERGQTRFVISPDARREVLKRLLELNLELAKQEKS